MIQNIAEDSQQSTKEKENPDVENDKSKRKVNFSPDVQEYTDQIETQTQTDEEYNITGDVNHFLAWVDKKNPSSKTIKKRKQNE